MITVYQHLLRLYPAEHRRQFADEMLSVFEDVRSDLNHKGAIAPIAFFIREITGLIHGALREHLRAVFGAHAGVSISTRRFTMRNEFRFPKSTAVLMMIILAGIVLALEKARTIQTSFSDGNPVVPMEAAHLTFFPTLALLLVIFYAAGLVGWAILFALRRSGVHRLAKMSGEPK
ncbi:MAG: hypothetical protein ABSG34_01635 [Candidatus Sulfotelmatobacter sp.]|jgi:hypothetical protein